MPNKMEKKIVIENFKEVIERECKVIGNASHVILPQKYRNKNVLIVCLNDAQVEDSEPKEEKNGSA